MSLNENRALPDYDIKCFGTSIDTTIRLVANGRSIPAPKRHSPAPTMKAHSKRIFEHASFRLRFVRPAPSSETVGFRSQDSQNWRVLAFWNWINLKSSLSSLYYLFIGHFKFHLRSPHYSSFKGFASSHISCPLSPLIEIVFDNFYYAERQK